MSLEYEPSLLNVDIVDGFYVILHNFREHLLTDQIYRLTLRLFYGCSTLHKGELCFTQFSTNIFNIFNTSTLKLVFSKTKTFFKKLDYCFLVHSTKIETAASPYKTTLSKANGKTNRMGCTNGPITKSVVLTVTTLFFWKFCFSSRTSYKKLIWCTNHPDVHIHTFRKNWRFIWGCFYGWIIDIFYLSCIACPFWSILLSPLWLVPLYWSLMF